ncbi:MAG: hypothetical protein OEM52_06915 [bacterium]|nr:hypothetical protein [bacterium]
MNRFTTGLLTVFVLLLSSIASRAIAVDAVKTKGPENTDCLMCHADPDLKNAGGKKLTVSGEGFAKSVHKDFACIDCHSSGNFDDTPHWKNYPPVNCNECHSDAVSKFMTGFSEHLKARGFSTIPSCTQCHGTHEMSKNADTKMVCGVCHNPEVKKFESSIHSKVKGENKLSCTSCHDAHDKSERGKMLPADWRKKTVDRCLSCHQQQSKDYTSSKHYHAVQNGNTKAPICIDCHSFHEIFSVKDARSPVHIDKMDRTCDKCHTGHEASIHRKSNVDPKLMTCAGCHTGHDTEMKRSVDGIVKATIPGTCNACHSDDRHQKENLAHGKIMIQTKMGKDANCTQCHIYHWKMTDEKHVAAVQETRECKNCHVEENKKYEQSAHGIAFRKGHAEAPTCVTCHGDKNIERISSKFNGQTILSLCSSCHANRNVTMRFQINPNVVQGYLNTYHGKMYALGYQGEKFATCVSCHDNHLILPSNDPQSSISKQHIIQTCARCHKDANVNFVAQLQHYDPMAPAEHPLLDFLHISMVWLLRITLTVFGLHTLFWIMRTVIDRIRFGKPKKHKSEWRYKRFNTYDRIVHAIVIVSFLTLATTGLPLKYSHTEIAYWVATNLLDLHTMAILHRIAAVMTFGYFALHLGSLAYKLAQKKLTIKSMLWGKDSLIPQPKDAKDFFQHIGYFLHIAKKPEFSRYTYWEKFDYMAVFWGVAVIGASGLTLWFPTFFTKLLPGWALNAAMIIHSEEALLATGFIFTIHFFNEHLRTENFPMDEVIFTGSVSEQFLIEERKLWYEDMKASGELEQVKVKPVSIFAKTLLYSFGFVSLAIGLALLAFIVIGTFAK